jgi:hypothetical protein
MQPAVAFTCVTLLGSSLTLVTTLVILVLMFLHLRRERDVALLLTFNTYLTIFAFSLVLLSVAINVLRADLFGVAILGDLNMTGCHFQGFLLFETFGCCYMSFVLQAFYRLARLLLATAALLILPIRLLLRYHIRQNCRPVLHNSDRLFPAHRLDLDDLCPPPVLHSPSNTSASANGAG